MMILQELQKAFPNCWFKPGKDFDGGKAAVWSGEGGEIEFVTEDGEIIVDHAFDSNCMAWNFGAHPELNEFVESRGYYWEAYDSGTFLLYKN